MSNIFNKDFRDFIAAFNACNVKYVLVGGYSVILHGYARTTGDMDLWVERSEENYLKIEQAFKVFGMPVFDMTKENFLHHPSWDVFTFGTPPVAIDLLVNMKGLDFQQIFERSTVFTDEGLSIRLIHINDLIIAKREAGRPKDLDDLENLR
jgi:predicted nucleotidyltransferase